MGGRRSAPRPDVVRANIDDVRRRAVGHGRDPDSIRFITSVEIVTDSTDSAARAKADELSAYHLTPGSLRDVAEHVIPELRRRGRAAEHGEPTTLRQRLFGASARLADDHPAAAHRR